jgi:hypothetical protein
MGGMADFSIVNALAAAAARSQGIVPATVFAGLLSFDINRDNPGWPGIEPGMLTEADFKSVARFCRY